MGCIEGDAADSGRGVTADSGQAQELVVIVRQTAFAAVDEAASGAVQIARAAVVSQPLPGFEHLCFGSVGERANGREAADEARVVGRHLVDAGLLQHDLGDPNLVAVRRITPRQMPFVAIIPAQQTGAKTAASLAVVEQFTHVFSGHGAVGDREPVAAMSPSATCGRHWPTRVDLDREAHLIAAAKQAAR